MSGARLRPPQVGELEALAALQARCFPLEPWASGELAVLLAQRGCEALVVEAAGGDLIGFLLLRRAADEAEVLTLGVAPERRRRGLAGSLLSAGLASLWASGVGACFLEVAADNAAALALYDRLGFRPVGRRQQYYRDGGDALVLRLTVARETESSAGRAPIIPGINRDEAK